MTYTPALPPMKQQIEARRRMRAAELRGFGLLMEMGTGKSKVLLDEFGELEDAGETGDLLVIAPAGVYTNWYDPSNPESEILKHLSPELLERTRFALWKSGSSPSRRAVRSLVEAGTDRPRVLLVNVEAFSFGDKAEDACREFLESGGGRATIVVDESTTIKGHGSARSKAVRALGEHAGLRRIATGLVTPRSPLDLYAQFNFLDWRILGSQTYYGFRARYAITKTMDFGGRSVKVVVGYRNVDELRERIEPHSYRVLKEDCLELPPKVYTVRTVSLSDEQRRLYAEMREFATSALDEESHVSATAVISQIIRMHQILCGHVVDENGGVHDIPCPRLEKQLVETLDEVEGKVIIWTTYDRTIHKITAELERQFGRGCTARFWGGNRKTRDEEERRWKGDPDCRFLAATPSAGGRGRTWTQARTVVYYANTWDLEHRSQSEDRPHRRGQTGTVTYVDLVCPGTVDEKIVRALRAKIDMATSITGENYREWII